VTSPSPQALRCGFTFEVGYGPAVVQAFGTSSHLESILHSVSTDVGMWLSPRTALSWRIATAYYKFVDGDDETAKLYAVTGPSLQRWINDWAWVSVGAGIAMQARSGDFGPYRYSFGAGIDARLGATLNQGTRHTFSLALEIDRISFFDSNQSIGLSSTYGIAALVIGYQYL
jgi:hypothetical protein